MVNRFLKRQNPSNYFPGDNVYVRICKGRKKREQCLPKIIKADHCKQSYKVQLDNGNIISCKVSDLAAFTREEIYRRTNFCRNRIKVPCQCGNDHCKSFASEFCSKAMSKNVV